jgi:hypothetical protein
MTPRRRWVCCASAQISWHSRGNSKRRNVSRREGLELAAQTDDLNDHAKALADLAEVLELAGRREEAAAALGQALELYERKGNLVMAERTRARLA